MTGTPDEQQMVSTRESKWLQQFTKKNTGDRGPRPEHDTTELEDQPGLVTNANQKKLLEKSWEEFPEDLQ